VSERDRLGGDLDSAEFAHGVEQGFWGLPERDNNIVYVVLHAPDGRSFTARMDCSSYWDEPILATFVDARGHQATPEAWPDGNRQFEQWIKFKSSPQFICWNQDRAGTQQHPEWKGHKAWQRKPNQLVSYLEYLRQMLNLPMNGYNRRNQSMAA
jgi:hypothetical protein